MNLNNINKSCPVQTDRVNGILVVRLYRRPAGHRVLCVPRFESVLPAIQPRVDQGKNLLFAQETSQWQIKFLSILSNLSKILLPVTGTYFRHIIKKFTLYFLLCFNANIPQASLLQHSHFSLNLTKVVVNGRTLCEINYISYICN